MTKTVVAGPQTYGSQIRSGKLQGGIPEGPARDPLGSLDSRRLLQGAEVQILHNSSSLTPLPVSWHLASYLLLLEPAVAKHKLIHPGLLEFCFHSMSISHSSIIKLESHKHTQQGSLYNKREITIKRVVITDRHQTCQMRRRLLKSREKVLWSTSSRNCLKIQKT